MEPGEGSVPFFSDLLKLHKNQSWPYMGWMGCAYPISPVLLRSCRVVNKGDRAGTQATCKIICLMLKGCNSLYPDSNRLLFWDGRLAASWSEETGNKPSSMGLQPSPTAKEISKSWLLPLQHHIDLLEVKQGWFLKKGTEFC